MIENPEEEPGTRLASSRFAPMLACSIPGSERFRIKRVDWWTDRDGIRSCCARSAGCGVGKGSCNTYIYISVVSFVRYWRDRIVCFKRMIIDR